MPFPPFVQWLKKIQEYDCTLYMLDWIPMTSIFDTHFHVSVQCTRSQLSNCHTASTSGFMGKHFYSGTLTKCLLSQCDHIPMTCVLSNSHQLTYQMIGKVYTQVTCLLIKYKWVMGMKRTSLELISKQTMATPLTDFTFADSQWETDMASIQK